MKYIEETKNANNTTIINRYPVLEPDEYKERHQELLKTIHKILQNHKGVIQEN